MTNADRDTHYDIVWNGERGGANLDLLYGGLANPLRRECARVGAGPARDRQVALEERRPEAFEIATVLETACRPLTLGEVAHALRTTPDLTWPAVLELMATARVERVAVPPSFARQVRRDGRPARYGYRLTTGGRA